MIRLSRPPIPGSLSNSAADEVGFLWADWTQNQSLKIKKHVYAAPEVKNALRVAQNNKCAYCETKNPRSHDVVEHFRPKGGWRQNRSISLQTPGYFWLAYEWSNLLFACDMCNDASHKQNLFPLLNPKDRATTVAPDISTEHPLLINPYDEDPSQFIEWNEDVPRAIHHASKGLVTIRVFKLASHQGLIDARRGHFNLVKAALETAEELPKNNQQRIAVRAVLQHHASDQGQYSAMIRHAFLPRINAL